MKKKPIYAILIMISFVLQANFVGANSSTIIWEGVSWYTDYHSTSTISAVSETIGGSATTDALKFTKSANYHAQAKGSTPAVSDRMVFSVDFYGADVDSWSWAPVFKIVNPDTGYYAYIKKEEGSYARWGINGYTSSETSGKLYDDVWYTFEFFFEDGDIFIKYKQRSSSSFITLYHGYWGGLSMSGNIDIILGTDRLSDYSTAGGSETYYYDNLRVDGQPISINNPWLSNGFTNYYQSVPGIKINEMSSTTISSSYNGVGSGWVNSNIEKSIDIDINQIVDVKYSFSYPSNYYMGTERLMFYDSTGANALWLAHYDAWAGSTGRYYIYGYKDGVALSSSSYTTVYGKNSINGGLMHVEFSNINHALGTVDAHVEIDKAGGGTYVKNMIGISIPTKVKLLFQYHDTYWSSSQTQSFSSFEERPTSWGFEESPIDWLAAPTSSGNSYSSSWSSKLSERVNPTYGSNYFTGITADQGLWIDEQIPNILEFDKLSTNVGYIEMSDISFNSYDNYSVTVDYRSSYIGLFDYTPAFHLSFSGGGYAFIQDVSGDRSTYNIDGTQGTSYMSINDAQTYRLEFKVTQQDGLRQVKLRYFDLSSLQTPSTSNDIGWVTMYSKSYPLNDYSFTGPLTVRLGTMQDVDHTDSGIAERYRFANFGVTTGVIESQEFSVQLFDVPTDIETDQNRYEITGICAPATNPQHNQGVCDGSEYVGDGIHIKVKEYDNYGAVTDDFTIYVSDGLGHDFNTVWRYDWFNIVRYEAYRPWVTLRSADWYDTTLKYSQIDGSSVTITETNTYTTSVDVVGTSSEVSVTNSLSETNSETFSFTVPNIKAKDGAIASVYVKHHIYRIEGEYTKNCYTCAPTGELYGEIGRWELDSIMIKDIDIENRKIVHTSIDVPEITGFKNERVNKKTVNVYLSNPGPITYDADLKEAIQSTISNTLSISTKFGAKFNLYGLTIGMSASLKYTYTQSITSSLTTSMMYEVDIYPSELSGTGTRDIDFNKINSFELEVVTQ